MSKNRLQKGSLLLAQPFMLDPNFKRAVVLITDHHPVEGTVGFVLNKKLKTRINDLIDDFPEIDAPVFVGGPVATETLHYIHDSGHIVDGSIEVMDGLYWGGDFEKLKFLIKSKLILARNVKFFLGYTGWSAGQLDDEMDSGSWMLADMDINYAFATKPHNLWKEVTKNKGGRYTVIAELPYSDSLN